MRDPEGQLTPAREALAMHAPGVLVTLARAVGGTAPPSVVVEFFREGLTMTYRFASFFTLSVFFGLLHFSVLAQESATDCELQILANKDFAVLKGKLDLLNTADQPTEILGNTKTPSKTEKAVIAKWVEEYKKCSKPGIEHHKSRSPETATVFENAYADLYFSAADLYQGKITYGDFARASVKRHQEVRARVAAIAAKLQAQHQLAIEEKQQAEVADRLREEQRQQAEVKRQQDQERQAQAIQAEQILAQQREQSRRRQYCESLYQQCMNRAINQIQASSCGMERAGCSLAAAAMK